MLKDEQIRAAHEAAIRCDLDRDALLAAFDRPFITLLPEASNPTAQLWEDLCALKRTGAASLRTTAASFAKPRAEASFFRERASAAASERSGSAPFFSATVSRRSPLPRPGLDEPDAKAR